MSKTELAAELRSHGWKNPDKKSDDTRGIQDLIEEALRYLLEVETAYQHRELDEYERRMPVDVSEAMLKQKFGLAHAIVSRTDDETIRAGATDLMDGALTRAAADYLGSVFREADHRGEELHIMIGGGIMVHNVLLMMSNRIYDKVHLYASAVIGRAPTDDPIAVRICTTPEMNLWTAWIRSGHALSHLNFATLTPHSFPIENFDDQNRQHVAREVVSDYVKELSQQPHFKNLLVKMQRAQVAVIGFGGIEESDRWPGEPTQSLTMPELLKSYGINPRFLIDDGVVGEFGYALLDANGDTRKEWQLFLTAGYPNTIGFYRGLSQTPGCRVIGIGNLHSYPAIESALKSKLINVLITDQITARKLLGVPQ